MALTSYIPILLLVINRILLNHNITFNMYKPSTLCNCMHICKKALHEVGWWPFHDSVFGPSLNRICFCIGSASKAQWDLQLRTGNCRFTKLNLNWSPGLYIAAYLFKPTRIALGPDGLGCDWRMDILDIVRYLSLVQLQCKSTAHTPHHLYDCSFLVATFCNGGNPSTSAAWDQRILPGLAYKSICGVHIIKSRSLKINVFHLLIWAKFHSNLR